MTDADKKNTDNLYDIYCELEMTLTKLQEEAGKMSARGVVGLGNLLEISSYKIGSVLNTVMKTINNLQTN